MARALHGACSTAPCRWWRPLCCWCSASGGGLHGVVLLPTITSNEASITLSTDDSLSKEDSYAVAGQVVEAVMGVENVEEVGITTDTSVAGLDISQLGLPSTITDLLNAANSYGSYQLNVMLKEDLSSSEIEAARQALVDATSGIKHCTGFR